MDNKEIYHLLERTAMTFGLVVLNKRQWSLDFLS